MVGRVEARQKVTLPSFLAAIQLEDGYNLNQIREGGYYTVSSPGGAPEVGDFYLTVVHGPVAGNASSTQCLTNVADGTEWVRVYVKTTGWSTWVERGSGSAVGTDLSIANRGASTLDIESSTGTDITLPAVTTSLSGLMTAADKTALDALSAGATSFFDNVFEWKDNADATKKVVVQLSGITTATTRTWTFPDADDTFVGTTATQTLSNKTLGGTTTLTIKDTLFRVRDDADATKLFALELSGITTLTTRTWTVPDVDDTFVGLAATQTLTNKTLGNTNTIAVKDTLFTLQDDGDATKLVAFQLSGLTTGNTRTLTVPDASGTLVLTTATQTLTNKTLGVTNTVSLWDSLFTLTDQGDPAKSLQFQLNGLSTARVWTFPDATDTFVGLTATQTLTNKTFGVGTTLTITDALFSVVDNADNTKVVAFEASGIATGTTRTLSFPNATGTIVLAGNTGTLQNKTLDNTNTVNLKTSLFTLEDPTTAAKKVVFDVSAVSATRTITYPSDNNITLVGTSLTQTLTNKTLGNTNTFVLSDSITTFQDNSDTSKQMKFELSSITTATTRTLTIPNATGTIALAADVAQQIGFTVSANPGIYPNGDTDTGLVSNAANVLMLMTNNVTRIWMGSSGIVSVGATSQVGFSKFGITQSATGTLSEAIAVSKTVETSGTPNNDANGLMRFFDPVLGSVFAFGAYDRSGDRVLEFATANDFDILFTSSGVTLMTMLEDGSGTDIAGELRCDSFRIDATPTASAATPSTHKLAVNFNGSVYYLLVTT